MPIYLTYEDGFSISFPGSTIYWRTGPISSSAERPLLGKSEHIRLRIEKYVDLFPAVILCCATSILAQG
jgi:hypothetical protein